MSKNNPSIVYEALCVRLNQLKLQNIFFDCSSDKIMLSALDGKSYGPKTRFSK